MDEYQLGLSFDPSITLYTYPGGSSSCSPQAEPGAWLDVLAHSNASNSSSISTPSRNSLSVNSPGMPNQQSGIGMRGVAPSDVSLSLSVTQNAENSHRNFGRSRTVLGGSWST